MPESAPTVSVVIPTHYRNEYLRSCLESVRAQTHEAVETIVVDDSGTEHAAEVVGTFDDVRYIAFDENRGAPAARNRGVEAASGEYVQFLDDDDRLHPEKLERQVELLTDRPQVGVAYCGYRTDGGRTVLPNSDGRGDVLEYCLAFRLYGCVTSTMLIEAAMLDVVAPLPEPPGSDDSFLKIELAARTEFDYVDAVLVDRGAPRVRRRNTEGAIQGTWQVLEEYRDLYDTAGSAVRREAESRAARREAHYRIQEDWWSPKAATLFGRAARTSPDRIPGLYALAAASLLGRPAYSLTKRLGELASERHS